MICCYTEKVERSRPPRIQNLPVLVSASITIAFALKNAVISTFLHRLYLTNSTWELFHIDLQRIRALLCNNGYPIATIDNKINKFISENFSTNSISQKEHITLLYQNQFTRHSKVGERSIYNRPDHKTRFTSKLSKNYQTPYLLQEQKVKRSVNPQQDLQ